MAFARFNARKGQDVILEKDFYHGGTLADPHEVAKVVIYKGDYDQANPDSGKVEEISSFSHPSTGKYSVTFAVPNTLEAGVTYRDVWFWTATSGAAETADTTTSFYLYDDGWYTSDGYRQFKYQVYPDIKQLTKGEIRKIELECVSVPLYKADAALDAIVVPCISLEVQIATSRDELIEEWTNTLIQNAGKKFLVLVDTTDDKYRKGNYYYQVRMTLPDGSVQVSQKLALAIL